MRGARIKGGENSYYHCISRVIDRKFVLKRQEKDRLVELLVQASTFSGVEVVTYVMMGNHFHLLIKANPDVVVTDPMLADRLKCLYGQSRTADIMTLLGDLKSRGDFASAEEYKRRFTCRMQDVSQFMKLFKQLYTRWHNSKYKRKGTLWEDRFKSVLVESGQALKMMAAYLDLNPVRAGIVTDPR
ncbi:MAG: transposase, partial [Verrucomicrobiota bacterium]|nr:transposase [Verrucomicrobiota bacterium]